MTSWIKSCHTSSRRQLPLLMDLDLQLALINSTTYNTITPTIDTITNSMCTCIYRLLHIILLLSPAFKAGRLSFSKKYYDLNVTHYSNNAYWLPSTDFCSSGMARILANHALTAGNCDMSAPNLGTTIVHVTNDMS
jgi:hypothetical protein